MTDPAAIDVHKDMIKVAVRVPGKKRGTRTADVLEYRTFYGVLQAMARELRGQGVTHVVTEASGVYTEPVWAALWRTQVRLGMIPRTVVAGAGYRPGNAFPGDAVPGAADLRRCLRQCLRPGPCGPRTCDAR